MRTGVCARRVGQAADKPRRPTVLELHTWWAGARVARWSHPTRTPLGPAYKKIKSWQATILHMVGIDRILRRAGDVNPLIDRVVAAENRGLTSPARLSLPHSFSCELALGQATLVWSAVTCHRFPFRQDRRVKPAHPSQPRLPHPSAAVPARCNRTSVVHGRVPAGAGWWRGSREP